MSKNKSKKVGPGRPSVEEDEEKQEMYLKIWTQKFFYKKDTYELAKKFNVTKRTIQNAVQWVEDNFAEFNSETLLKGAKWSTEQRLQQLVDKLDKEFDKEGEEASIRNIVELNREIRKDQQDLMKLQNIMEEKFEVDVGEDTAKILKALNQRDDQNGSSE